MLTCWCGEVLLLLADMFFVLHPGSALGENSLRQDLTLDGGLTSSLGPRSSFVLGGGQTPPPCHCTPPQSVLLSFHVLWKPQVWQNSRGHRRQSCWTLPPRRMNHSSLCHVLKNEDPILLENRLLFLPWKSRSRLGIKKWKEKKNNNNKSVGSNENIASTETMLMTFRFSTHWFQSPSNPLLPLWWLPECVAPHNHSHNQVALFSDHEVTNSVFGNCHWYSVSTDLGVQDPVKTSRHRNRWSVVKVWEAQFQTRLRPVLLWLNLFSSNRFDVLLARTSGHLFTSEIFYWISNPEKKRQGRK